MLPLSAIGHEVKVPFADSHETTVASTGEATEKVQSSCRVVVCPEAAKSWHVNYQMYHANRHK
jgi:hypothetical protein